jgi:glycerol-1-phosphate dehydrogenase [NAD(P)+]
LEIPEVFVFDEEDENEAASELRLRLLELGGERPYTLTSRHGETLAGRLHDGAGHEIPPRDADQEWATELGRRVKNAGADVVVAIGGGRTLDVAKIAAARSGVTVITVPTQLSHDGIASPVAVIPDGSGRTVSIGAIAPRSVFLSLPTLCGSSAPSAAAGIGDLLANPLALRDWALAAERGLDEVDERAWHLSVESYRLIESDLDTDLVTAVGNRPFLRRLADALILSGAAMIRAGNSRPASGAEHEIAHALDELYGGRALHGAQVAFGCIVSVALYGEDHRALRERLLRLGLPQHPRELGLDEDAMVRVLLRAPSTRPGRFTILEEANLDEGKARALVREVWGGSLA